jgi:hypothetical protein
VEPAPGGDGALSGELLLIAPGKGRVEVECDARSFSFRGRKRLAGLLPATMHLIARPSAGGRPIDLWVPVRAGCLTTVRLGGAAE